MTKRSSPKTRGVKQINEEEFKPNNDEEIELNNNEKVKPYGEYVRHTPAWLEYLVYIIDYRVKPDNDEKVKPDNDEKVKPDNYEDVKDNDWGEVKPNHNEDV